MPDAIYTDRTLAALYDSLNPAGDDTEFYGSLLSSPGRILDIGCGTGLLTVRLAAMGHDVTGVEPAEAMLEIARARPGGDIVRFVGTDARNIDLRQSFDLVLMTGHVFQVFLEDEDALAVLRAAKRHLAPGGRLVFDSRNPAARAWEEWTPQASVRSIEHNDLGPVRVWHEVTQVYDGRVRFLTHTRILSQPAPIVSESTLAFRDRTAISALLAQAGFVDATWLGGWDGEPFGAASREIIPIAS